MAMGLLRGAAAGSLLFPLAVPGLAMFPPLLLLLPPLLLLLPPTKLLVLPLGSSSTRGPGMRLPRVVMLISEGSPRKRRACVGARTLFRLGMR